MYNHIIALLTTRLKRLEALGDDDGYDKKRKLWTPQQEMHANKMTKTLTKRRNSDPELSLEYIHNFPQNIRGQILTHRFTRYTKTTFYYYDKDRKEYFDVRLPETTQDEINVLLCMDNTREVNKELQHIPLAGFPGIEVVITNKEGEYRMWLERDSSVSIGPFLRWIDPQGNKIPQTQPDLQSQTRLRVEEIGAMRYFTTASPEVQKMFRTRTMKGPSERYLCYVWSENTQKYHGINIPDSALPLIRECLIDLSRKTQDRRNRPMDFYSLYYPMVLARYVTIGFTCRCFLDAIYITFILLNGDDLGPFRMNPPFEQQELEMDFSLLDKDYGDLMDLNQDTLDSIRYMHRAPKYITKMFNHKEITSRKRYCYTLYRIYEDFEIDFPPEIEGEVYGTHAQEFETKTLQIEGHEVIFRFHHVQTKSLLWITCDRDDVEDDKITLGPFVREV